MNAAETANAAVVAKTSALVEGISAAMPLDKFDETTA